MPRKKDVMGYYMPSDKDREAYGWCINNGIYISPFAKMPTKCSPQMYIAHVYQ